MPWTDGSRGHFQLQTLGQRHLGYLLLQSLEASSSVWLSPSEKDSYIQTDILNPTQHGHCRLWVKSTREAPTGAMRQGDWEEKRIGNPGYGLG